MFLEARCLERGYTLDEVMQCVVAQNGEQWTIDVDHPAYPRHAKTDLSQENDSQVSRTETHGPGTELHALLGRFGLTASGDCKCNQRARYMDEQGCGWCEANIEEIVGWLRESAADRGLPFLDVAGRVLVRRAIANARRKEQARAKEAKAEGGATAG